MVRSKEASPKAEFLAKGVFRVRESPALPRDVEAKYELLCKEKLTADISNAAIAPRLERFGGAAHHNLQPQQRVNSSRRGPGLRDHLHVAIELGVERLELESEAPWALQVGVEKDGAVI